MKVFIVAEAGVNHNGNLDVALQLIDVAVRSGADAIKFQTFKADRLVTATASKANYQIENMGTNGSQFEMLEKLELSPQMHRKLLSYCRKKNIIFMSTPFDEASVDLLDNLGMQIFKIPSGEITNKPLIQHIATKGKSIILSTGMSYLDEVGKAISWIDEVWETDKQPLVSTSTHQLINSLTLLHCVSSYPAAAEDSNLSAIKTMERAFGLPVGYSDHSIGIEISIAAVTMGAKVIEKHFTLNRNMEGPDHKLSLEPDELETMVRTIRTVEKAIGDGLKKPTEGEIGNRNVVRKSLVASKDIRSGKVISSKDIVTKRPGDGISPEFKDLVIGMRARRKISADSVLKWEYLRDA